MHKPGEPIKNGTLGSFATFVPDSDRGVDLGATAQHAIGAQFIREQWLAIDDSEEGELLAHAAGVIGMNPDRVAEASVGDYDWANFDLYHADQNGGYSSVGVRLEVGGDVIVYRANLVDGDGTTKTVIHRADGPAMIRHGHATAYLDGVEQHCPDTLHGYRIRSEKFEFARGNRVVSGWDARWEHQDGRSVVRYADGSSVFYNAAGRIERMGAPAVIDADGTEHWYHDGAEIPDPRPAEATLEHPEGAGSLRVTGARYDAAAQPSRIARAIRDDIARAQLVGLIPADAQISVSGSDTRKRIKADGVPVADMHTRILIRQIIGQYNRSDSPLRSPEVKHFAVELP